MELIRLTTLRLGPALDDAEARMRRALDVSTREARPKSDQFGPRQARHFAQDGDVPVVRLPGRKDPGLAASMRLEEELQAERAKREETEALLRQANAQIQTLKTQVAHAEFAQVETANTLARTVEQLREAQERIHALEELRSEQSKPAADAATAKPGRKRREPAPTMTAQPAEPAEPIQWWIPGWRNGTERSKG